MATSVSRRVGIGSELRSLHATSNRTILSQEEMVCRLAGLFLFWHFVVFGSIAFHENHLSGGGGAKEVLARPLLETIC